MTSKDFSKAEKAAKINKAVFEVENFNLDVDEDDIEESLEVVPEELTNEEFLELEQEYRAEEEVTEKEIAGEDKEYLPGKYHSERFRRSFCRPQQTSLKV